MDIAAVCLALVLVLAYNRTLKFGYIVDDLMNIQRMKRAFDNKWRMTMRKRLYGCGTLGVNPKLDHAFTIFLNFIVCYLIYVALGSVWASLLYAVHPFNHQTSVWMNGRRYQVSIILALLSLIYAPIGLVFWPVALYFQPLTLFAPVVYTPWAILAVPAALWFLKGRFGRRLSLMPVSEKNKISLKRAVIVVKTYGFYFTKMLIPGVGQIYRKFLYYWGITDGGNKDAYRVNFDFLKGVAAIAATGFLIWQYGTLAAVMALSILLWSNMVTATMTVSDRYMAFANIFMCFFIQDIAFKFLGFYAPVFLAGLLVYYFARTLDTLPMYQNIEEMYRHHIHVQPEEVEARSYYIGDLLRSNRVFDAITQVNEGLHYNPTDFKMLFYSGMCAHRIGQHDQAVKRLKEAKKYVYLGNEENNKRLVEDLLKKINPQVKKSKRKKAAAK